jgi:hypothetical protein
VHFDVVILFCLRCHKKGHAQSKELKVISDTIDATLIICQRVAQDLNMGNVKGL